MRTIPSDTNLDDKTKAILRKCKRMAERFVALKSERNIPPTVRMEVDVLIDKFGAFEDRLHEETLDPESLKKVVFELIKLIAEAYRIALKLGP